MSMIPRLWMISISTTKVLTDTFVEYLERSALAVSILTQPRQEGSQIEAFYDHEPGLTTLHSSLSILAIMKGAKPPKIFIQKLDNQNWLKKVAADFPPIRIARWTVHGAAHRRAVPQRRFALQIDATNAFGTGEHPTTRGCLEMLDWLLKRVEPPLRMLDMGCGSGILAMAYAQVCRGRATAVDLDTDSIQIAKNNVRLNGLQNHVSVGRSYGYSSLLVQRNAPYDIIMANIFARPLSEMAKDLKDNLRPGGLAILSGLLNQQANMVLAAHRLKGLYLVKHLKLNGWSVLALKRPTKA